MKLIPDWRPSGIAQNLIATKIWAIFLKRKSSFCFDQWKIVPSKIQYFTCIYICFTQKGLVLVGAEGYVSKGSSRGKTKRYSKPTETTHQEPYHTLLRFCCNAALPIWLIHKYSAKIAWNGKNCSNSELLWGFCSVLFVIEIELKRTYVWFNLCILLKELQFLTSYQLYWLLQTSDLALTEWLESCFYNCHLVLCCKTLMYKLCQPCLKYKQRDFSFFLSLNDFSTCLIKQLPIIHHKYTHVILKGKSLKIELANKELPPRLVSKCIT